MVVRKLDSIGRVNSFVCFVHIDVGKSQEAVGIGVAHEQHVVRVQVAIAIRVVAILVVVESVGAKGQPVDHSGVTDVIVHRRPGRATVGRCEYALPD